jgi:F-type H+-transporting ATPase subunit delta
MRLVILKNREAFLLPALTKLVDMIKTHKRQTTARIVSAVPLTDAQATQLTALLAKKLGKQVDITVLVDPSVIAGISIQVDGYFLDRTVRSMLKDMKENLKGE